MHYVALMWRGAAGVRAREEKDRLKRIRVKGKGGDPKKPWDWAEMFKFVPTIDAKKRRKIAAWKAKDGDHNAQLAEAHFNLGSLLLRMRTDADDAAKSAAGLEPTINVALDNLQLAVCHDPTKFRMRMRVHPTFHICPSKFLIVLFDSTGR
jgi:hypothetical protein